MYKATYLPSAIALLVACLMYTPRVAAGPWSKEDGQYYAKAYTSLYGSDEGLSTSSNGQVIQGGSYLGLTTGFYGELGLPRHLTIQLNLPYVIGSNRQPQATYGNAGLGDLEVGLQRQFVSLRLPTSLRFVLKAPLYNNQSLLIDSSQSPHPALGDGQFDFTTWLSAGGSFWPHPFYAFGELGYRHRSELGPGPIENLNWSDGITLLVLAGYSGDKWRANLFGQGVYSFTQGDSTTRSDASLGASGSRRIAQGWWLSLEGNRILWAINATSGTSIGISISHEG